jgi:hypothetical protein
VSAVRTHKPLAYLGVAAVSAGVWHGFGATYGLITVGGLLIFDALT